MVILLTEVYQITKKKNTKMTKFLQILTKLTNQNSQPPTECTLNKKTYPIKFLFV